MQLLIDFGPVIAFVVAYWLTNFKTAVAVIMGAVVLQIGATWLHSRTIPRMSVISAGLVLAFGAISLLLDNELVFKWKPTVLYWCLAIAFLISAYVGQRTLVQRMLEAVPGNDFDLAPDEWKVLNWFWIGFFLLAGLANILVAYAYSEPVWVNFKLFGLLGITLVFVVAQSIWIASKTHNSQDSLNAGED